MVLFKTHQARRHPGVSAAEAGLPAEILTQRETTHTTLGTLCREGEHTHTHRIKSEELVFNLVNQWP